MARQFAYIFLALFVVAGFVHANELPPRAAQGPPDALLSPSDALIDSWLNKRQFTCSRSDYRPCADGSGCCPSAGKCCTIGCGRRVTDTCCVGGGTCPSGWRCCTLNSCYPVGGECCTGGRYCTPGNHCYRYRGRPVCCSNSACTAYVSSGTTISVEGGYNTDYSTTTYESTTTLAAYRYYYYTVTWYYVSYYWTFIEASTTTSTTITTSTRYSVYASNTFAADNSFSSFSESIATSTPYEATSLEPSETARPASSSFSSFDDSDVTSSANDTETPTEVTVFVTPSGTGPVTNSAVAASSTSLNAATSSRNLPRAEWGTALVFTTFFAIWIGGGALMIWL